MERPCALVRGDRLLETDGPNHLVSKYPVAYLHVSRVWSFLALDI
jgi:hypothetical protein